MANAYLAFEQADEDQARAIAAELERNGWTVTPSSGDLRQAEKLPALVQTIGESNLFVVLASRASAESQWLQREVAAALNNGRPIVIAQTDDLPNESWIHATLDTSHAVLLGQGVEALAKIADAARTAKSGGRVLTMLNIKGGVGKTVLAANLFAAAHLANKRSIAFIDLDPQHNLTQYFLSPGERHRIRDRNHTIYGVLNARGDHSVPAQDLGGIAIPLNRARKGKDKDINFELVAGDERLFEFTLDTRSDQDKAAAFLRFRALVAALRARNDAVIIDSNPCATFLTRLAITTADHIIAPVRPEKYSLTGLNMLEHVVREVRGRALRSSEFSVLLNGVNDRTRSGETGDADALTRGEISAAPFFSGALLAEEIPYSAVLKSAPSDRLAANPINVTAMMRVGGRPAKEALTNAAAAILRRAQ
ncbi:AAA family ATPase [Vitreimonas flagellata]|uniref:AAA family ATPase n=1 Tax=Vitreimonas flagellata TaxID=2560861 RepID=UPI001074D4F7|nr:AAA family ATPase [Vitreimonas flagellata]